MWVQIIKKRMNERIHVKENAGLFEIYDEDWEYISSTRLSTII